MKALDWLEDFWDNNFYTLLGIVFLLCCIVSILGLLNLPGLFILTYFVFGLLIYSYKQWKWSKFNHKWK